MVMFRLFSLWKWNSQNVYAELHNIRKNGLWMCKSFKILRWSNKLAYLVSSWPFSCWCPLASGIVDCISWVSLTAGKPTPSIDEISLSRKVVGCSIAVALLLALTVKKLLTLCCLYFFGTLACTTVDSATTSIPELSEREVSYKKIVKLDLTVIQFIL